MCECLEYDDGAMHLCEVCAGIYRDEHEQLEMLRGFVEKIANIVIYKKCKHADAKNQFELFDLRDEARHIVARWQVEPELF